MSPTEEKLHAALDDVGDYERFVDFAALLVESLKRDGPWENKDLESFLQGLATVATELDKWYGDPAEANSKRAGPHWQFLAEMLFAARCQRTE